MAQRMNANRPIPEIELEAPSSIPLLTNGESISYLHYGGGPLKRQASPPRHRETELYDVRRGIAVRDLGFLE
jgi:hypothetical protein